MPGGYLADKYAILGQQAQASNTAANAQRMQAQNEADMGGARRGLMGAQSSATYSQGGLYGAEAGRTEAETREVAPNAAAQRAAAMAGAGEAKARGGLYGAEAGKVGVETGLLGPESSARIAGQTAQTKQTQVQTGGILQGQGGVFGPPPPAGDHTNDYNYFAPAPNDTLPSRGAPNPDDGFAKGTSKVPAKGGGAKGGGAKGAPGAGVDAKLAPGEAVLNPGAAQHMGRGLIGALNLASHNGTLSSQQPHLGGSPHAGMPASIGAIPGLPPPAGPGPAGGGPASGGAAPLGPQGLAKGSSNVQQSGGAIGKDYQGSLGQGPGKPTPTLSLAKGMTKVPGKPTHPSKDTVKAKLPPGGAVLTNDAANHVGRGLIAHLNALHAAGAIGGGMPAPGGGGPPMTPNAGAGASGAGGPMMPPPRAPMQAPPGFAGGTSYVSEGDEAHTAEMYNSGRWPGDDYPPPDTSIASYDMGLNNGTRPRGYADGTSYVAPSWMISNPSAPGAQIASGMVQGARDMYNSWMGGGGGPALHPADSYNKLNNALTPR